MKENTVYVTVVRSHDNDGYAQQKMYFNEKYMLSVYPLCECPEDAILERDLIGCADVADYMNSVALWIKSGMDVIFNDINVEDINNFSIKDYLNKI